MNNSKHGFFRLPPELRIMVYKHCLVPGLIRPSTGIAEREIPGLPLLRTCQTILTEARYELYKNTFIVSDCEESDLIYEACLQYPERRRMLKSLELRFGPYELCHIDHVKDVTFEVEEEYPSEAFQQYGPRASRTMDRVRRREIHARLKILLRDVLWDEKMAHILDDTELEHLRLNLFECDCHLLCCDLYYNAFETFEHGFARGVPKRLELVNIPETSSKVERLKKDWVGNTTFGTLKRMGMAPGEQEMIKQLKGWDYDSFKRKVARELKSRGKT